MEIFAVSAIIISILTIMFMIAYREYQHDSAIKNLKKSFDEAKTYEDVINTQTRLYYRVKVNHKYYMKITAMAITRLREINDENSNNNVLRDIN